MSKSHKVVLDDQQLANDYRDSDNEDQDYDGSRAGARCSRGHANMRVVWRNPVIDDRVYNVCLECNRLYGRDWEGGAQYSAGELVHLSDPERPMIGRAFYLGWPEWWLEENSMTHDDVNVREV